MKKKFITPLLLFVIAFTSVFAASAQEGKKIIAVINRADWCQVCRTNSEKMMKEVMPVFNASNVQFVMNDLTNNDTKASSKAKLEELKVFDAVKSTKTTGLVLLVDTGSGKLLEKISVAEPAQKLVETIQQFAGETKKM